MPPAAHCLVDSTGYGQNAGPRGCGPEQWAEKWGCCSPFRGGSWVPT